MDEATDRTARQDAILVELAELGLAFARNLQARGMATEDDALAADLALAFQRTARSVRQTLALESRLQRDRRRVEHEDLQAAARETRDRVYRKRIQIRRALAQEIWNEYEDEDEAEARTDAMGALLMDHAEEADFLDAPIEACIDRLRTDLGLAATANTAEGDNDPTEPVETVIWNSSG